MENSTARLDKKAIRVIVKNRIEAEHPHFSQLKRKEKKNGTLELTRFAGGAEVSFFLRSHLTNS